MTDERSREELLAENEGMKTVIARLMGEAVEKDQTIILLNNKVALLQEAQRPDLMGRAYDRHAVPKRSGW